MPIFHTTSSQGRADTFYLETTTKSKLLTFLNSISTAVVRNIKEVVYSKHFNVNYVKKEPFVSAPAYHKVIIFAYSNSYSQQFILYNVKKSITKDILINQYKKLYILNELIEGFYDIQFYNEVSKNENIDNLYQVQYSRNSKTYTEDFYSDSFEKVKDFFETVIDGELLEIRKYVHLDNTIKKDDGDYHKRVNLYIKNDDSQLSISLPKIKTEISHNQLLDLIVDTVKINGLSVEKNSIKLTYR